MACFVTVSSRTIEERLHMTAPRDRITALRLLLRLFPVGAVVDLGTGHGKFARIAANAGWDVTAVDARAERWPADPRVHWVRADVRDVDLEPYDLVLCLGIFYHLTVDDQLALLRRAHPRPIIIDTHLDHGEHEHDLSERVTLHGGFDGRYYREPGAMTSSWKNERSFWPTLASFHRMLGDSGYSNTLTLEPWFTPDRTFFVALPD
jgi:SAM-dependent methyltransferase